MHLNIGFYGRLATQAQLSKLANGVALVLLVASGWQTETWASGQDQAASVDGYKSPYSLNFTISREKLAAPDKDEPRGNPQLQSQTPYSQWYSDAIRERFGTWGPEPRRFPPPFKDMSQVDDAWMRQRLLFVGESFIGLPYQHHHIPGWDPPADWPWKEVSYGKQSKGVDCSNFTSWLYNYGLGIKLTTNVHKQADEIAVEKPDGGGTISLQLINKNDGANNDDAYANLVKQLTAGDLLYIRNKSGEISHVIMWAGQYGKSPDNRPLVLDCTDMHRKDCNGNTIPVGVRLRPFTPDSWYFTNFSHAHRIIPL